MRGLSGDPDPFYDTFVLPLAARAVVAGITLGVFDSLAAEPASPAELAARLGLDPLGVDALCTALVSLGYLELEDGRCHVSAGVAPRVVRGAPESIATFAGDFGVHHWEAVGLLERVVRHGETAAWHDRGPDDPLWEAYINGLFELPWRKRPRHDYQKFVGRLSRKKKEGPTTPEPGKATGRSDGTGGDGRIPPSSP